MLSLRRSNRLTSSKTTKMKSVFWVITTLVAHTLVSSNAHYMNQWAIEVDGDTDEAAKIAKDAGCENKGK